VQIFQDNATEERAENARLVRTCCTVRQCSSDREEIKAEDRC